MEVSQRSRIFTTKIAEQSNLPDLLISKAQGFAKVATFPKRAGSATHSVLGISQSSHLMITLFRDDVL